MCVEASKFPHPELELVDEQTLAKRLLVKPLWVKRVARRTYTADPLPALRLGRAVRFLWGSCELSSWIARRFGTNDANGLSEEASPRGYNQFRTGSEPNRKEKT